MESNNNEEMHGLTFLIRENILLLEQGQVVLQMVSADHYSQITTYSLVHSSPGMHFRHLLNFYQILFSSAAGTVANNAVATNTAIANTATANTINYDLRIRDERIEGDPLCALRCAEELHATLSGWLSTPHACPVVEQIAFVGGNGELLYIPSTFERELKAVSDHTLHHYALIAQTLRSFGYSLPKAFGVAPSTLTHVHA